MFKSYKVSKNFFEDNKPRTCGFCKNIFRGLLAQKLQKFYNFQELSGQKDVEFLLKSLYRKTLFFYICLKSGTEDFSRPSRKKNF